MKLRNDDFFGEKVKLQLDKCGQQIFLKVELSRKLSMNVGSLRKRERERWRKL